jgi:hypothetical protein
VVGFGDVGLRLIAEREEPASRARVCHVITGYSLFVLVCCLRPLVILRLSTSVISSQQFQHIRAFGFCHSHYYSIWERE